MELSDTCFSLSGRYSIGAESESSRYYVSVPVSNGIVDYEEYYEIIEGQYQQFLVDEAAATDFVEACRRREHNDLLLQRLGSNRGIPVYQART
ncbi:hypothetical protein [Mycobacterium sp. 852002-51057_SCH5723018]|uniref:hypothetical protein n=1 Tax=Mycobacterium sp. 852002-51057_SCH5723018 TaxID=1834094 RepID=UPI0009EF01F1|nr:hypothetical protein [Mycobacterium sp. 852002-51057_SCH5723018]